MTATPSGSAARFERLLGCGETKAAASLDERRLPFRRGSDAFPRERVSGVQVPRGRRPRVARESPSKPSTRFARADQGATRDDLSRSHPNPATTEQTPEGRPRNRGGGCGGPPPPPPPPPAQRGAGGGGRHPP